MTMRLSAFPLLLLLLCLPSFALADFAGKVIAVKDGDTLVVLNDSSPVTIRLQGIDAPEIGQAYGRAAKKYASGLAYRKYVKVHEMGTDRYGRTLGDLTLPGGRDFSEEMLRAGYAWHYKHYNSSKRLADLEDEAKSASRGLWADPKSVPPWEYRRLERALGRGPYRSYEYHAN